MKTWMRTVAVAMFLTALGACGGSTGPQGPAGATGATGAAGVYNPRGDMYCNSNSATSSNAGFGVYASVACSAAEDLPVSGGCIPGSNGPGVALVVDHPAFWDSAAGDKAQWQCMWSLDPNSSASLVASMLSSQATICCIKHP